VTDSGQLVLTPSLRTVLRRSMLWIVITVAVILIAAVSVTLSRTSLGTDPLSSTNPAPNGAKALAEVLGHEGVTVVEVSSLRDAIDAVADDEQATVLFYDPNFFLTAEQTAAALELSDRVIVVEPSPDTLELISGSLAPAGFADGEREADCDVREAQVAESITARGIGIRILDDQPGIVGCFADDDVYSLVIVTEGERTTIALGASQSLSNDQILEQGNAALALNLLGATETLVWYIPGVEEFAAAAPTRAELSPPWLVTVSWMLLLVGFLTALWRGRRLGPLVVENLPVTVRASETMRGRARLYQKANARLHSLDSLRIGTIARLASQVALPALATVDEVSDAVAALTGQDATAVRELLIDARPESDRQLIELSDRLLELEQAVTAKIRPH
jgi:hypothetical protein